jgi:hypothetical protein
MLIKDKLNALHEINEYIKSEKKKYDDINSNNTTHKRMNSNDHIIENTHIHSSKSSKKSFFSSFNPLKKRPTKSSSSNINSDNKID